MGGTIFYKSQDNLGRAVCYNGPSGDYRAIHSAVIFGALREGAFTKSMLMTQYTNYLLETVDVSEFTEQAITHVTVSPNPFTQTLGIRLSPLVSQRLNVEIFDISGRRVRTLFNGQSLTAEAQSLVWDGRDDHGHTLSSGTYIVRIETENETVNKAVVFMN
jgi:flagellar hook assembly protein FlgD